MLRASFVALLIVAVIATPVAQPNLPDNYISQAENVHLFTQIETQMLEDFGIPAEEAWDCGWYGQQVPRAAVSLAACKDYVSTRQVNCVEWTKGYGQKFPKIERHISLDEVYIKCRHVKDKLDQLDRLPGDTATCIWCMQNVNTN